MTLRDDINKSINEEEIEGFRFLNLHGYAQLLDRVAERFLKSGRTDLESIWLWERFKEPVSTHIPPDAIEFLDARLPKTESYWFLASDEDGKYWVAEATGAAIVRVLQEMYCFEYYIVERKMEWILCENHHNALIEAGTRGILPAELGAPPDAG